MKYLFVYNPYSRYGLKEKEIEIIKKRFIKDEVIFYKSEYQGSIEKYVFLNGFNFDLIVACGGDGTIHEMICGAIRLKNTPLLALLPRGTMNDVARSLGYKSDLNKSLDIIQNRKFTTKNVYSINDTYFLYGMAIGRYSNVSYETINKKHFGVFSYYFSCLKEFFKSHTTTIVLNGKKIKISQLFILNNNYLAGYKMEFIDDKKIYVKYSISRNRLFDTFKFLFFLLARGKRHFIEEVVDELIIEGTNLKITLDGEKYETNRAVIKILDKNIRMICK